MRTRIAVTSSYLVRWLPDDTDVTFHLADGHKTPNTYIAHEVLRQASHFHTVTDIWMCQQEIQGDQQVSVHLMITTQKVTSNDQSVLPHYWLNLTAWQPTARTRGH
jgi:hypothetical protein